MQYMHAVYNNSHRPRVELYVRHNIIPHKILFFRCFQEEEELIEEWQPEPLVPAMPTYDVDAITPNVVQG